MNAPNKVKLTVLPSETPAALDAPLALPSALLRPEDVPDFERSAVSMEGRTHRTSSYTIFIDLPGAAEEVLLVHGYTGAYDKVSKEVARYLRAQSGPAPKPLHGTWSPEPGLEGTASRPSDDTLQALKKRGHLTQMTPDEEEAFFTNMASKYHRLAVHRAPGYILMPTYQCNLRCPYCFQDHMRTNPAFKHLLRVMQPSMVDRIFRGMVSIEAAHGIPEGAKVHRHIVFFGGEPLLTESRPIISYIMEKAMATGTASFSAISNGTELDAYRELLGPGKISALQITLDGPPREHDKRRVYADGSGSFDRIAANVTMALELGVRISMRMNIDRTNIEQLPQLAEEYVARGWDKHRGFSAYVAPVHPANGETNTKAFFNSWELNRALRELAQRHPAMARIGCADDGLLLRARQVFDKRSDPLAGMKSSFCSAHSNMYVIDAFADIYACWERTGDKSLRIGAIGETGEVRMNRSSLEIWRKRSVVSNPVCRKCRYATYCGGGCAVLAEGQTGSMYANHCDGFGKRFRASVAQAYMDHVSGVQDDVAADRVCDM